MAIPFSIPSEEDAEESYRQLDLLLEHLVITLREVMLYRRMEANYTQNIIRRRQQSTPQTTQDQTQTQPDDNEILSQMPEELASRLPLPDLIPNTHNCGRVRHRNNKPRTTEDATTPTTTIVEQLPWVQESTTTTEEGKPSTATTTTSVSQFLSLIRPQFGWTSLAILLGWKFLTRTR